jgi:uncharacterized protein (DUF885 family)
MRFLIPALFLFPCLLRAADVRPLIDQYEADARLFQRHWEISGDSTAALDHEQKLWEGWLQKLRGVDFAKLNPTAQVDYVLTRNDLEATLDRLRERRETRDELTPWLPFRTTIEALADARVNNRPLVADKAASSLAPLTKAIQDIQAKLKATQEKKPAAPAKAEADKTPPPADKAAAPVSAPADKPAPPVFAKPTPYQAKRTADAVDGLAKSLKQWFANYDGFLPEFSWWAKQPYDEAAKALEGYAKYLREDFAGIKNKDDAPLIGKAIGEKALKEQLMHEFIPYTPQDLIVIGEREFAWCEAEMKKAAREMKLGDDWKQALTKVKQQHVKPGEQEAFVRAEGLKATDFVKKHKLVTVPPQCEEWWSTRMLSVQEQKQIPYAAYSGHDMLVAYANEAMKQDDKMMSMRGNNRAFTHNVVPHEIIPGHHLQSYMAARHLPYRRAFGTPFFIEGWALYWEMHLWDLGYHTTPEERIGALFWRMHRCARIIVTMKFHLGEMKPDEMVSFLTDRVGHEKFGATSEVRRFIAGDFNALYQAAYMMGGLQLRALHKELVGSGQMTEMQFHDAILKLGPLPVELLRAALIKAPLTADYQTQWKFDTALKSNP